MKLQSFLANSIEGYIRYRKISGRTSYSYVKTWYYSIIFVPENIRTYGTDSRNSR